MARSLGIESRLRQVSSLALGTSELSVLELTTAYATLANGGVRMTPLAVKAVLDRGGNVRWSPRREGRRVIRPETAYRTTILLEGPLLYGTASTVRSAYGFVRPAAGKTGTTDDENDAWFIGYSPDLAAGVWVGCDRHRRLGLTGTQAAVPIWARFMQSALQERPFRDFEAPQDVVDVWIDGDTGYRAGPECLHVMRAAFLRKTEPRQLCPVMHLPFWSDSLPPDSTMYEGPREEAPNKDEEEETPPEPKEPTPSGDAGAGGSGTGAPPGN
jgi:membrane carboxypeptidase/penicillin-binding protein